MNELFIERGKRLHEVLDYLREQGRVKTQKEMAEAIDCTPSQLSRALKGREEDMTENLIHKINRGFDNIFSKDYIWEGKGTLLVNKGKPETPMATLNNTNTETPPIPYIYYMQTVDELKNNYREKIDDVKNHYKEKVNDLENQIKDLKYNLEKEKKEKENIREKYEALLVANAHLEGELKAHQAQSFYKKEESERTLMAADAG